MHIIPYCNIGDPNDATSKDRLCLRCGNKTHFTNNHASYYRRGLIHSTEENERAIVIHDTASPERNDETNA